MLVELRALHDGVAVAASEMSLLRLRPPPLRVAVRAPARPPRRARHGSGRPQAGVANRARLPPVVPGAAIGAHKAELYTRALVGDIVHKRQHLADPGWLVRVGLYLEFLTFLGIVEAVRDDVGDLLTPAERDRVRARAGVRGDPRARSTSTGWRDGLGAAADPVRGLPRTGPVSALNLLAKGRRRCEFLHVHHEDLKHAIALAGPNQHNAQETWHRVFRDAERAVLRRRAEAFPELSRLPPERATVRALAPPGPLGLRRALRVPGPLPRLFGDQDGLFALGLQPVPRRR